MSPPPPLPPACVFYVLLIISQCDVRINSINTYLPTKTGHLKKDAGAHLYIVCLGSSAYNKRQIPYLPTTLSKQKTNPKHNQKES